MKIHELLITDDIFSGLRLDFNMMMRKTLHTMQSKGSDSGEVNLKLKISLNHGLQKTGKKYINPKFEHKITSVIQMKNEVTGTIEGRYELNSDNGQYYIQEIEDPQCSLFDGERRMKGGTLYGDDKRGSS